MIPPQLTNYVRQQLAAGTPKEVIIKNLAQNGWSAQDIEEAMPVVQKTKASSVMSKVLVSVGLVMASTAYAFYQYTATPAQAPVATTSQPATPPVDTPVQTVPTPVAVSTPPPTPTPTPTPTATPTPKAPQSGVSVPLPTPVSTPKPTPTPTPVPTPTPAPKPVGQYIDGSYTGSAANAYYGFIQVKAIIQGAKLTDVQFLQHPSDRRTSQQINNQAMPMLRQEAIDAQSANVDGVSGATDSSQAFIQSLGSALALAKN